MNAEKVKKFEDFLNDKLKPDLKYVLEKRDKIYEEVAEFAALKNSIDAIKKSNSKAPLKLQVDLGSNFYAQGRVEDPKRIFVDVGLGFVLELTLDEAVGVIDKRVAVFEEEAKRLTDQACKIKANIKLTLEGLRELQGLK